MQSKILVCSLVLSLVILNVVAQDVDESDDDVDFQNYEANLVNAVETFNKYLKTRDARSLQRRGWLKNVWNNVVKPVLTSTAVKVLTDTLAGKRTTFEEALKRETRDVNGTQCVKDAEKFKEVKKAASRLCGLAQFPDVKCH